MVLFFQFYWGEIDNWKLCIIKEGARRDVLIYIYIVKQLPKSS